MFSLHRYEEATSTIGMAVLSSIDWYNVPDTLAHCTFFSEGCLVPTCLPVSAALWDLEQEFHVNPLTFLLYSD